MREPAVQMLYTLQSPCLLLFDFIQKAHFVIIAVLGPNRTLWQVHTGNVHSLTHIVNSCIKQKIDVLCRSTVLSFVVLSVPKCVCKCLVTNESELQAECLI